MAESRAESARQAVEQRLTSHGLRNGLAIGTFLIELPTPAAVRSLALAGFSFVVIDLEHSTLDLTAVGTLLSEARACGFPAIVRVPVDRLSTIGNVLDAGASGVMVPHVDNVEAARAAVAHARFAPLGERGFSPLTLLRTLEHPQAALNEAQLLVVQIEGREGIRNAAEIGRLAGIDVVFVGPYDLAESLGTPSDIGSRAVIEAAASIASSLPPGVRGGIYMDDPRRSKSWAAAGFSFQCINFDGQMLLDRAREVVRVANNQENA